MFVFKPIVVLFLVFVLQFFIACSDKEKTAGGAVEDQGVVALENKSVSGVSQKGPFVKGSSIQLFELDGSFIQTGNSFTSTLLTDNGDYTFKVKYLESQYAVLVTNGYYKNEITGKTSTGPISLRAISDLSQRELVNVNVLTQLEYERVLVLLDSGKSFTDAKKQAKTEVLNIFKVGEEESTNEIGNLEDLDIFSSGEGDAALLAISILLQGNRSEGELTSLITEVSTYVAANGSWNEDSIKTQIADWAYSADLMKIRENVGSWKRTDSVPNFEKYVKRFWWLNYGLGICDKDHEDSISINTNNLSKNADHIFVCHNGDWVEYGRASGDSMETWDGSKGSRHFVINGDASYQWYFVLDSTDVNDLGSTDLVFGNGTVVESSVTDSVVKACSGMCTTITFGEWINGKNTYKPWAITGLGLDKNGVGVDASSWKGLCVTYQKSGSGTMALYLDTDHEADSDKLQKFLENTSTPKTVDVLWEDFAQEGWGAPIDIMDEMVNNLFHINFMYKGFAGDVLKVNVMEVGAYGTCGSNTTTGFSVEKPFEPWTYEAFGPRVMTNLITDTVAVSWAGKWYGWTDGNDGARTIVNYGPADKDSIKTVEDDKVTADVIAKCKGMCGTIHFGDSLKKSEGDDYDSAPWAVQKVSLVQNDKRGEDVSSWVGFCVEYQSDVDVELTLVTGVSGNNDNGWVYSVLPKSADKRIVDVSWLDFKQMDYAKSKIAISEYLKKFIALFFFEHGEKSQTAFFNISKIGAYGTCGK